MQKNTKKPIIKKVFITRNRNMAISNKHTKVKVFVHNGKTDVFVKVTKKLVGRKMGILSMTKKMGKSIHDSVRNRKRKNKKNQSKK